MGMSLDGYVASDREHPGVAVPEDAELVRWKMERLAKAGAHVICLGPCRARIDR
jgi:hypothetical protein